MLLYTRSLIVYGTFSLVLFLVFPMLFILFWHAKLLYLFVSAAILFFLMTFIVVYRWIYKADLLKKARERYRMNVDFIDELPNAMFIWQLSIWMLVIELLLSGMFIGYMSGDAFLAMYPLWMIGTGVVFSVSGHLIDPALKKAGTLVLSVAIIDLLGLILYLFTHMTDIHSAHYLQIAITVLTVGIYPIWLGARHAR